MKQIFSIAKFSIVENISNRIFNGFIFFGLLIIFSTVLLKELSLYEGVRVIKDTGFFLIEFLVLLIAIYVSSTQFLKEKQERSIYLVLTKPVSRGMYIVGKALGMIGLILLNIVIMAVILIGIMLWEKQPIGIEYFYTFLFMFYKLSITAVLGIMFSVFSESFVTANIFTFSVYIAAHGIEEIKKIADKLTTPLYKWIVEGIYYALPNFRVLNYKDYLKPNEVPIDLLQITSYSVAYMTIAISIAILVFHKRKL